LPAAAVAAAALAALTAGTAGASGGSPGAAGAAKAVSASGAAQYQNLLAAARTKSSGCTGFSSQDSPPSTIRVLRKSQDPSNPDHAPIDTVPFETYVKNVLPNEWIPSWDQASLQSGAMAAKTYAWWWVNHSSGNITSDGRCYDVNDTTDFQVYRPGSSYPSTDTAVDSTWAVVAHMNGALFDAEYRANLGSSGNDTCGEAIAAYPDRLSQWGSQACAQDGQTYQQILRLYYPGIELIATPGLAQNGGPQVALARTGRRDVFAVNSAGHLMQRITQAGSGGTWTDLGGSLASAPSVTFHDNRYDIFAVSTSGALLHRYSQDGSWSGYETIAQTARYGVGAVYRNGIYDVFTISAARELIQYTNVAGRWSGAKHLGGLYTAAPTLTFHDGRYDVFGVGTGRSSWQRTWQGAWQPAHSLGGIFSTGLSAIYHSGRYDVFGAGSTGRINQLVLAPGWSVTWRPQPGLTGFVPAADYLAGTYTLTTLSSAGHVRQMTWTDAAHWSSWSDLGGPYPQP
ncbi:MAG: SpoIID/LytB domain-containing protein, partial [Mycobacteriales bacterium]